MVCKNWVFPYFLPAPPSFPMHSPSVFFLSLRLNISVPAPYIQSWRLQFPASERTFAKPGKITSEKPLFPYDMHPNLAHHSVLGSQHCPLDRTTWKCSLHFLWQERQGRRWGGKTDKRPWDSDFLWVCRLGVAGRQRARIPATATPVNQNFPPSLGLDYLDVIDFSDKTELRWFKSFKVYPKGETFR